MIRGGIRRTQTQQQHRSVQSGMRSQRSLNCMTDRDIDAA